MKEDSFYSNTGWGDDNLRKSVKTFEIMGFFFKCQSVLLASLSYIPLT